MKIIFICSSLWPGRDGVGDYCRRLSAEFIVRGHGVALIGLRERGITAISTGIQQLDGVDIPVLQIPEGMPEKEGLSFAKKWVNDFNPDRLSLQFVPFGYHPRGLRKGLSKFLLTIGGARPWHIMFHELWVGMAVEESTKLKLWGKAQRFLIKSLVSNLQPIAIHTQTQLYITLLSKLGFRASFLPLFGNIPVVATIQSKKSLKEEISFVVFGTIHSGAPIDKFAKEAANYGRKKNIPIKLIFVGRCGVEQERWATIWQAEGLPVELMGEQDATHVSKILKSATFGLSATAIAVIDKSGSFAAMRDHGLPVISISKPWQPIGVPKPPIARGIVEYNGSNFAECIEFKTEKGPVGDVLLLVATEMLNALSKF